jgi:hypothetical protein
MRRDRAVSFRRIVMAAVVMAATTATVWACGTWWEQHDVLAAPTIQLPGYGSYPLNASVPVYNSPAPDDDRWMPSGEIVDDDVYYKWYYKLTTESGLGTQFLSGRDGNWTATSTAGHYTLSVQADDSGSQYNDIATVSSTGVDIVAVDRLQYDDGAGYTDVTGAIYEPIGSSVTFKAIPDPSDASWPTGKASWSDTCDNTGTGSTFAVTLSQVGTDTVTAECGNSKQADAIAVAVGDIQVSAGGAYTVTGQTITVLLGSKYTFTALPNPSGAQWPDDTPTWSGVASGTESSILVTFDSQGTKTLTAKCGPNDTGKSVTIHVMCPWVYRVGFGGDNALYETPTTYSGWGDGTTAITDPVRDLDTSKNDPVCVNKNSGSVSLTDVRLKVSEALTYAQTISVDAAGTENWTAATGVSFSGCTSSDTTLAIGGNIIDEVKRYSGDFSVAWKYKVTGTYGNDNWMDLNTTTHTVYVTYGTPAPGGDDSTVKRIDWVCDKANGQSTVGGGADAVFGGLSGSFDLGAAMWGPSPIWRLHNAGEASQCPGIADYVNQHFRMLGLGTGEIRYCRAKPDGTYEAASSAPGTEWRVIVPGGEHPDPTTHDNEYGSERLAMVDGNGDGNAYEATCLFNSTYYALTGDGVFSASTPEEVVETAFGSDVEWQWRTGTSPDYMFHECTEAPWTEAP